MPDHAIYFSHIAGSWRRTLSRGGWALALALSADAACALGLGNATSGVPIGQALDYAIPIRLEAEESLTPECVSAEVQFGDRVVPAQVRLRTGNANTVVLRVSTSVAVDEPVVAIAVSAGCSSRVSRRYTVFADPGPAINPVPASAVLTPGALPSSDVVTATQPAGPLVASGAAGATGAVGPSGTSGPAASSAGGAAGAADSGAQKASARMAPAGDASNPRSRAASRAEARAAARAARAAARAQTQAQAAAKVEPTTRASRTIQALPKAPRVAAVPPPEPRARLTLEPAEAELSHPVAGSAVEEALAAVAEAASQAKAAAAAASANAARIAELERGVERARAEAKAKEAEAATLRLHVKQTQELPWWSYALFGFSVLMALVAAWMAWRMRGMQQAQEVAWARASALPAVAPVQEVAAAEPAQRETSPLPLITSELTEPAPLAAPAAAPAAVPPTVAAARRVASAAAAATTPTPVPVPRAALPAVELPGERTSVLPPSARVETRDGRMDDGSPRDVSIEELIDVDQQAEFFIAIGQDHAAIELLVAHLRNTGGGSPLTYLKLLDIYQRLGMQEDYERTRSRFNHRFNAYAPEWGADPQGGGRSLEDYEGVVPRLQGAWARPLDAMAELEALLFRKSRGELFDLNAYREVLFLYGVARDLMDRDSNQHDNVDLLLPLNLGAEAPKPLIGDSRATSDVPMEDHPTAPLDLDLTPILPSQSIFSDPMADTARLPRPR